MTSPSARGASASGWASSGSTTSTARCPPQTKRMTPRVAVDRVAVSENAAIATTEPRSGGRRQPMRLMFPSSRSRAREANQPNLKAW